MEDMRGGEKMNNLVFSFRKKTDESQDQENSLYGSNSNSW